jgi:hypothetical protein
MITATSTHFQLQTWSKLEKTPIHIALLERVVACPACHRDVKPERIVSPYLSRPLWRCSMCNTVLQKERE